MFQGDEYCMFQGDEILYISITNENIALTKVTTVIWRAKFNQGVIK